MSERAAMAGDKGPAHALVHKGRTYTMRPVITEGVMLEVEALQYRRAKEALYGLRDAMSEEAYMARLDRLRDKYEAGGFAFEHVDTQKHLQSKKGAIELLQIMMDCNMEELLMLLAERGPEVQDLLKTVLETSLPKARAVNRQERRARRAH